MATGRARGRPANTQTPMIKAALKAIKPDDLQHIPPFPSGLNEDGELMWIKIWAGAHGWLHDTDEFIIGELCQVFQDKELYRRSLEIGAVPRTYRLSNKTWVAHPYVNLLSDSRKQMNSMFSSLGFSPADRAKIGAMESLQDDPILEMMQAKLTRTAKRYAVAEEIQESEEEDWQDAAENNAEDFDE